MVPHLSPLVGGVSFSQKIWITDCERLREDTEMQKYENKYHIVRVNNNDGKKGGSAVNVVSQ